MSNISRGRVSYEWDVETVVTETDEVCDHNFADVLTDLPALEVTETTHDVLVLVRTFYSPASGDYEVSWAYVDEGKLPDEFTTPNSGGEYVPCGVKVPQRFHHELARISRKGAK